MNGNKYVSKYLEYSANCCKAPVVVLTVCYE